MGDPNNPPACRFLESGSHDDIERAQLLRDQRLPELPEFDPNKRTFVFLEVAVGNRVLGEPPRGRHACCHAPPTRLGAPQPASQKQSKYPLCTFLLSITSRRHFPLPWPQSPAPHNFLPTGRLVIELFDDHIPVGASHFRSRCMPGSRGCLAGCAVQKLVPHYAAFLGKS